MKTHIENQNESPVHVTRMCDGRMGVRRALQFNLCEPLGGPPLARGPDTFPPVLDFIASDATLDRFREIIVPSGWQLEAYRRNPVFQNAHQYGDILFTLGKALITEVRQVAGRPALFQRIEFAVSANPIARIAYELYKGKFLNGVSVGFVPIRWENGSEEAGYRRKYLEQELVEVSAVGIPANPNALQMGLRSGAIRKAELQELHALLSTLVKREVSPLSDPRYPLLAQLARDIQRVIKSER